MVFITPDLFNSHLGYNRSISPASIYSQPRNTMVDTQQLTGLGKRKRRTDNDEDVPKSKYELAHDSFSKTFANTANYSNSTLQERSSPKSKGLLRLHASGSASDTNGNRTYPISAATSAYTASERRPTKQMKRLNPKIALVKSTSHLMDVEPDPAPCPTNTNSHTDLRSCHACNAAPKRKRDLENYMECKRCVERTCYICARECVECGKAICKKCIVEVGEEGDSWCLVCYSKRINS
jgi:hypothetical protein